MSGFISKGGGGGGGGSPVSAQFVLSAAGCFTSFTNGASSLIQVEQPTNQVNSFFADFLQGVQSFIEWDLPLPTDYDGGTVTAIIYWISDSDLTDSVVWGLQGICLGNGDQLDQPFGIAQEVTQANAAGGGSLNITASTAAITLDGTPQSGGHAQFKLYRLGSGADTLAATARFLEARVTYTRSP